MNLVVDTNIIISALITPEGTISKLLFQDLSDSQLVSPHFIFDEIISKYDKIQKITGHSNDELKELFYSLIKHIDFINNDLISNENQKKAFKIVEDIDKKDVLFVALAIQTGFSLWSGDLKLINGLKAKGFTNVIETRELIERIKK